MHCPVPPASKPGKSDTAAQVIAYIGRTAAGNPCCQKDIFLLTASWGILHAFVGVVQLLVIFSCLALPPLFAFT